MKIVVEEHPEACLYASLGYREQFGRTPTPFEEYGVKAHQALASFVDDVLSGREFNSREELQLELEGWIVFYRKMHYENPHEEWLWLSITKDKYLTVENSSGGFIFARIRQVDAEFVTSS